MSRRQEKSTKGDSIRVLRTKPCGGAQKRTLPIDHRGIRQDTRRANHLDNRDKIEETQGYKEEAAPCFASTSAASHPPHPTRIEAARMATANWFDWTQRSLVSSVWGSVKP